VNILADQAEYEIERQRDAARFYGHRYDLIKVRGELKLRSRLGKKADVEITKELLGEVLEESYQAKDTQTAKGIAKVNPKQVLVWEMTLEPGQEATLTYVYQVYARI